MAKKKSKIKDAEEIGPRYADKIDKMTTNWTAKKPILAESWQKRMNEILAKHGGVRPEKVENFRREIEKVTPEDYKRALERGKDVLVRNYIRALAVSPKV